MSLTDSTVTDSAHWSTAVQRQANLAILVAELAQILEAGTGGSCNDGEWLGRRLGEAETALALAVSVAARCAGVAVASGCDGGSAR